MRLRAQQSCPALANTAIGVSAAARSQSASANTTHADFPPSSSDTRVMFSELARRIAAPVAVSPVNPILSTRGSLTSASPTTPPGPGTTETHPSGTPASTSSSPSRSADNGVSDAGLMMTELPHARAGAVFHVVISIGKFHGTISAHTPTGSRSTTSSPSSCTGTTSPKSLLAAPA